MDVVSAGTAGGAGLNPLELDVANPPIETERPCIDGADGKVLGPKALEGMPKPTPGAGLDGIGELTVKGDCGTYPDEENPLVTGVPA